jgi:hypothetical protein
VKIAVFTSNQPRHLSLIAELAAIASEVFVVQECNTLFPGRVADFFRASDSMRDYFANVQAAERAEFGDVRFHGANVRSLSMKMGDLSAVPPESLSPALACDRHVVFGASYVKGPLVDALVERRAINIHMGVSPYYRGSSCNFWALHDSNAALVGATIHRLSRGLDSGGMLFHAMPEPGPRAPFALGMRAVRAAHRALAQSFRDGSIDDFEPVAQDRSREIRYTRNADFTDAVASEFLARSLDADAIARMFDARPAPELLRPRYF